MMISLSLIKTQIYNLTLYFLHYFFVNLVNYLKSKFHLSKTETLYFVEKNV